MLTENPVIKFSPFEALLIGEKNRIAKRKPMKNTIFVTRLSQQKRVVNLRELFDVKEDDMTTDNDSVFKKPERVNHYLKGKKNLRVNKNNNNKVKCKSKSNSEVYCYEFEGRKVIVKSNEMVKIGTRSKKIQSNKVKFKPEFKYKETLEERIVNKMQRRKKKSKNNTVQNGVISQEGDRKSQQQRHSLRGKNGKFIRKEDYDKMVTGNTNGKTKCISDYLKRLYTKKSVSILNTSKNHFGLKFKQSHREDNTVDLPKKKVKLDQNGCDNILDDISNQYYENIFSKEVEFPPVPENLEVSYFDDDTCLLDILYECKPRGVELTETEDFDEALENTELIQRRKGLKMYERKKSNTKNGIREIFNNSLKENHCINKGLNVNKLENLNGSNRYMKGRRNGVNYLIDERPTKDNHLISDNKFRSLFYKTACGSETYLGNIIKPVLLNSSFGRLPDIS